MRHGGSLMWDEHQKGFSKGQMTFHAHPEPRSEEEKNKAKQNVFGEIN